MKLNLFIFYTYLSPDTYECVCITLLVQSEPVALHISAMNEGQCARVWYVSKKFPFR